MSTKDFLTLWFMSASDKVKYNGEIYTIKQYDRTNFKLGLLLPCNQEKDDFELEFVPYQECELIQP